MLLLDPDDCPGDDVAADDGITMGSIMDEAIEALLGDIEGDDKNSENDDGGRSRGLVSSPANASGTENGPVF